MVETIDPELAATTVFDGNHTTTCGMALVVPLDVQGVRVTTRADRQSAVSMKRSTRCSCAASRCRRPRRRRRRRILRLRPCSRATRCR